MKKIFVSILLVSSFVCFSQHTKKRTHKKVYKKHLIKKNSIQKVNDKPTIVPIEEAKEEPISFSATSEPVVEKIEVPQTPEWELTAEKLIKQKGYINNRNSAYYGRVELFLKGVYTSNEKMFFLLEISNRSNITYDVRNLSFVSSLIGEEFNDEESRGEKYFTPAFSTPLTKISKKSTVKVVYVFEKFVLNDKKQLKIELKERNGERILTINVPPKYIINAKYYN